VLSRYSIYVECECIQCEGLNNEESECTLDFIATPMQKKIMES
jgi:hypothetical protein